MYPAYGDETPFPVRAARRLMWFQVVAGTVGLLVLASMLFDVYKDISEYSPDVDGLYQPDIGTLKAQLYLLGFVAAWGILIVTVMGVLAAKFKTRRKGIRIAAIVVEILAVLDGIYRLLTDGFGFMLLFTLVVPILVFSYLLSSDTARWFNRDATTPVPDESVHWRSHYE